MPAHGLFRQRGEHPGNGLKIPGAGCILPALAERWVIPVFRWLLSHRRKAPDLKGLAEFAKRTDRRQALFFVGREAQIGQIERRCARTLAQVRRGEPAIEGPTRLLQGAPGAGKTAVLSELRQRWKARGRSAPVAVIAQVDELEDPTRIAILIAEAVSPGSSKSWRTTHTGDVSGSVGVGVADASGRAGHSTAPDSVTLNSLRETMPPKKWRRPVCLMVDEIQDVRPVARPVLRALHLDTLGLPIVPVYAGLGDSYQVLKNACSPRMAEGAIHDIGALAPEEAEEAVELMLDRFRVDRTGADGIWPRRLAEASDRWPQHLHNGMRALAEALVTARGRLADVDGDAVATREREIRENAYSRLMSEEMKGAKTLIARIMATLPPEGAGENDIRAQILLEARPEDDPGARGRRLPENMIARGFLTHLVHRGALQENARGLFSCPIPSFRSYLISQGGIMSADPVSGERRLAVPGGSPREPGVSHPLDVSETDAEAERKDRHHPAHAGAGSRDAGSGHDTRLRDRVMQLALALTERIAPAEGIHGSDMERRIGDALRLPSSGTVPEADIARLAGDIARRRAEADIRVDLVRSMSASPLHESAARYQGDPGSHQSDHRKSWAEELPERLARLGRDGVTPSELEREVARVALAARGTPFERLTGAMADALGFGTLREPVELRRERGEVLGALAKPTDRLKPLERLTLARRLHQAFTGLEILALAEGRAGSAVPEADRDQVAAGVRLLLATPVEEPAPWRVQHERLGRKTGAVPTREVGMFMEPF